MKIGRWASSGGSLLTVALVVGCGLLESPPKRDHAGELAAARALWAASGVVSYDFELRRVCECLLIDTGPVELEVRDGAIVAAQHRTLGPVGSEDLVRFPTVPDLFDLVADAIAAEPHLFFVAYDVELGYPHQITVDFDPVVADDELGISVADLSVWTGSG